jgi:peptidoglycan/LPS O-acetylase OafA/YrhL
VGAKALATNSLGDVLDRAKGRGPGFDLLRIVLAIGVVWVHILVRCGADALAPWSPGSFIFPALVPMFFAVSGFLVMGSALRVDDTLVFMKFRVLRIVPALLVDVVFCALILGPLVTTLTLSAYLRDPMFARYFLNVFGNIQYFLPYVFRGRWVNASLWTILPEIICYAVMALLMLARAHRSKLVLVLSFLTASCAGAAVNLAFNPDVDMFAARVQVFIYFLCGGAFFHLRRAIPYRPVLFALSLVAGPVLLQEPSTRVFASPFLTYCIVFLGLTRLPQPKIIATGDYSYGIYLYHCPLLEFVVNAFPRIGAYGLGLATFPLVFAFAAASWHFVEKPTLRLKAVSPIERTAIPIWMKFALALVVQVYVLLLVTWSGFFSILEVSIRGNALSIGALMIAVASAVSIGSRSNATDRGGLSEDSRKFSLGDRSHGGKPITGASVTL